MFLKFIKNLIGKFLLLSALAGISLQAYGNDDIYLGNPTYGGTGCPLGSVAATLSPDSKTLSMIFDQYVVEAGGTTGKRVDRKNCQIALPVHIPQGYSFSIIEMDYRGFNALPAGGSSQLNLEYFLAFPGSPVSGPRFSKRWFGPMNQDYLVTNRVGLSAIAWSPCGGDLNLRTSASLFVVTNQWGEQAMSTVDSMDTKASILYQLQWRRCN